MRLKQELGMVMVVVGDDDGVDVDMIKYMKVMNQMMCDLHYHFVSEFCER